MKRKIIKLAEKTLVVSLPTSWVENQSLKKGDELECIIQNEQLLLSPFQKKTFQKIEINIQGTTQRVLRWQISSLHKQGYDEIIVSDYDEEQYVVLQDLLTHLFIGFIVKERSKLRIVIGEVAFVDVKEFDAMLRRAFRTLNTAFEDLKEGIKIKELKKLIDLEHNNNKVTNFCERLLNKNLVQKEKGHFWYVLAWNLEKILDNFKYLAIHYKNDLDLNETLMVLVEKTQEFAKGYYECFYDFNFQTLIKLSELKKELLESWIDEIELGNRKIFAHYMHVVVMQIADFSASMIAIKSKNSLENSTL